jgi:hypothetical protein
MVTARVPLRPQWFFYAPPILVSNEVRRDGTAILSVHPSHSKVIKYVILLKLIISKPGAITCTPLRTCVPEKWQKKKIEGIKEVDIDQVVTEFAAKKNRRLCLCL